MAELHGIDAGELEAIDGGSHPALVVGMISPLIFTAPAPPPTLWD